MFPLLQMKDSLLNLQRGIGLRDYSSEAEEKRSRYHWHTTRRPWGHAVQYRTCFVCEPVCRQQQDRQTDKTDRWTDRTEGEAGPTVSWSNRHKERNSRLQHTEVRTPQEEEIMDRKCPDRTKELRCPQHHWGIVGRCKTGSFSTRLWDNCFLLLSYFQVHPTVSHVDQTERTEENYCMHLDNLAPLSQC